MGMPVARPWAYQQVGWAVDHYRYTGDHGWERQAPSSETERYTYEDRGVAEAHADAMAADRGGGRAVGRGNIIPQVGDHDWIVAPVYRGVLIDQVPTVQDF